jgi:hypothetical protein
MQLQLQQQKEAPFLEEQVMVKKLTPKKVTAVKTGVL